jgi:hypothetical protein
MVVSPVITQKITLLNLSSLVNIAGYNLKPCLQPIFSIMINIPNKVQSNGKNMFSLMPFISTMLIIIHSFSNTPNISMSHSKESLNLKEELN